MRRKRPSEDQPLLDGAVLGSHSHSATITSSSLVDEDTDDGVNVGVGSDASSSDDDEGPTVKTLRPHVHLHHFPRATPRFVWVLALFAGLGGMLFGYDTGVIGGALLFIKDDMDLSVFQTELVVSMATVGAMVGSLAGANLTERLGRRPSIIIAAAIFVVGAVLLALAPTYEWLLVGRLVVGVGIGLSSMCVPVYIAEVSPPAHRGMLVTSFVLFITGGQFLAYIVDSALAGVPNNWRWMLGVSAFPALLQLAGMFFMPESPRYLVGCGQISKARGVLELVIGPSAEYGDEHEQEIKDIQQTLVLEQEGTWSDLFHPDMRKALVVGVGLQLAQQLTGINTAMYYSPTVIRLAGFSKRTAIWYADAVAFCNMVMTIVAMRVIDRVGRRKLLLVSLVGLTMGLVLLGVAFFVLAGFSVKGPCDSYDRCAACVIDKDCGWCGSADVVSTHCLAGNKTMPDLAGSCPALGDWDFTSCSDHRAVIGGYFTVAALVFYVSFFAVGMGCVPWTLQSEIFPLQVRGKANGLATAANWTANLVVSLTFLSMAEAMSQAGTFGMYAAVGVLATMFVYFRLPETNKRTLEEIRELFI